MNEMVDLAVCRYHSRWKSTIYILEGRRPQDGKLQFLDMKSIVLRGLLALGNCRILSVKLTPLSYIRYLIRPKQKLIGVWRVVPASAKLRDCMTMKTKPDLRLKK
jgi:hypothetical protein